MRNEKIDALKCLAMFMVVLGHAIVYTHLFDAMAPGRVPIGAQWIDKQTLNSLALNLVYSVHMPLFAFLSSYTLWGREGAPSVLIRKRALSLMLPYVVWVLVSYATVALQSGGSIVGAARYLGHRLLFPQSPGAAWFLYALFGCFVVFALVRALGGSDRLLIISAVIVASLVVVPLGTLSDIFGVYDVAWLYPFFVMGYLAAKYAEVLTRHKRLLMWGGLVLWAAFLPIIWPVLVPEVNWWYPGLREALHSRGIRGAIVVFFAARYACGAAGIVALYYLYDFVHGRARAVQAWVGRRTLGMYVIQSYVLLFASSLLTKDVVALTSVAFLGSLAVTRLLELNRWTNLVFLGQARRLGVRGS